MRWRKKVCDLLWEDEWTVGSTNNRHRHRLFRSSPECKLADRGVLGDGHADQTCLAEKRV